MKIEIGLNTRVKWECDRTRQVHYGTVSITDGPYVGVTFDERPGVLQFHHISELVVVK